MAKLQIANRYGIAPHNVLYNKKITMKAKGLYTYMQSKPDGREFSAYRIAAETKDGRESIQTGLQELEKAGLLTRKKYQNELGQRDRMHTLHETDQRLPENPSTENPSTENPSTENPANKQKRKNKKDIIKKIYKNKNTKSKDFDLITTKKEPEPKKTPTPYKPKKITTEITALLDILKKTADELQIAYDTEKERLFAKHILTAQAFGDFAQKIGLTRTDLAIKIMIASDMIGYRKGPCAGTKMIYQEYSEVYNLAKKAKQKTQQTESQVIPGI